MTVHVKPPLSGEPCSCYSALQNAVQLTRLKVPKVVSVENLKKEVEAHPMLSWQAGLAVKRPKGTILFPSVRVWCGVGHVT